MTKTLSRNREVAASQVGTADGEARRRRHVGETRDKQCAPRLLLGQEQQGEEAGRAQGPDGGSVAHRRTTRKKYLWCATCSQTKKHDLDPDDPTAAICPTCQTVRSTRT